MKVLFFIHSLNSGGAERVLSLLVNHWAMENHEIIIAVNRLDNIFYDINPSIKLVNANIITTNHAEGLIGNFKRILRYRDIMLEVNPDIVISFMTSTCILTTLAAKMAKKPIILSEHSQFFFLESRVWRLLRRIVYPFSNALVVLTAHDKKKYKFHKNTYVIENPVIIKNKHKGIHRKKTILAVGRLSYVKGFDMLLQAFSSLQNNYDWKLLILGEGSERENLEKLIINLNLEDSVSLPGNVTDVEKHYRRSSIFVLPSRSEGFPMGLCEAMSYGCPPVAFDCLTGPKEIISHDKNGLLVKALDVEQLSSALQSLVTDDAKRIYLAKNTGLAIKRLNINIISEKWFSLINNILTNNK